MCSDAPPPPDFTPLANAMREVGDKMAALGQQQLAFGQQRYQETMPLYQQLVSSNLQGQQLAMEQAQDPTHNPPTDRPLGHRHGE